jgi:Holliday junction resolvase RusA-like endonuclease
MTFTFTVYGQPQTAGSKRAFAFRRHDGSLGASVTDDNAKGAGWKGDVAKAARTVFTGDLLTGALRVSMVFYRPRPKGHFNSSHGLNKAGRDSIAPTTKPDVLKLARCAEDALTGVVWRDDALIVTETLEKKWGEPARLVMVIETIEREAADGRGPARGTLFNSEAYDRGTATARQ